MIFNVNGINLYYEDKGNRNGNATIAFFNGVMASTNSWDLCVPSLTKFNFRVICHDFKGQLRSDKPIPDRGYYTFAEHAAEAKALFDYLGVTKVHLVGTSYGGEVAMKFAATYPEMVASLTIIDSVSELDEVCKGFVAGWKTLCDTYDGEKFFKGMAPSIYGREYMEKNRELMETRAKALLKIDNSYFDGQKILYDSFVNDVYMTDVLKNITCPTLIICGQDDILKPQRFSEIIYENIADCEFAVLPHCGHVTIFEQPKVMLSLILGFIMKTEL